MTPAGLVRMSGGRAGLFAVALSVLASAAGQAQTKPAEALPYEVDRGIRVTMRDGVRLSANIYRPRGARAKLPVILMRTPYSKDGEGSAYFASLFTQAGYALVVEDKRGRFESEGLYIVADHEIADSYDTIEWISRQRWSSGRVGAYGCSDPGDATIYAAVSRHPALKTIIAEAAGSTTGPAGGWFRYFGARNGGAVELAMGVGWMVDNGTKYFLRPPAELDWNAFIKLRPHYQLNVRPPEVDYDQALAELPIVDILKNRGLADTDWENLAGRPLTDPFFEKRDFLKGNEEISVPALHVNSWYDFAPGITLWHQKFFESHATNQQARDNQYALVSPSLHCQSLRLTDNYKVGARPLGDPRLDVAGLYIRWFDHWLKEKDAGIGEMAKVQYYMMGENVWRTAPAWPPPESKPLRLYLGGSNANGPAAAGTLTRDGGGRASPHRFTYDPGNPVPTVGGSLCCIRSDKLEGAYDQRAVEARPDVLTYSTPPFSKGLAVAGPVELVLHVSSSARDTDFTAKLVDVQPDGTAYNLQEAILRARYRDGFTKPKLMKPGEIYELRISLQDVANFFGPGHRLRLEISSSNFPRFDRNLNSGGRNYDEAKWTVAENVIHLDSRHPSYLTLRTLP